jgi:hypothetical protein
MKQPTMNEDLLKYPIYELFENGKLVRIKWLYCTAQYDHSTQHLHHFVRQSIRKNSPDFYKRVEHLQKLILMPAQMNLDLEAMGEKRFFEQHGINKNDLVFSRLKWREGYYDKEQQDE